jgi:hypothetical protein
MFLNAMILRLFSISRFAALLLAVTGLGLGFGAAPAAAGGCGYYGCYAAARVVVQPYYYQSCSCCGCGTSAYYTSYYPAYTYPSADYGYATGYDYATGYGYGYEGAVVAPRVYRPRAAFPRYFGPRRYIGPRRAYARY